MAFTMGLSVIWASIYLSALFHTFHTFPIISFPYLSINAFICLCIEVSDDYHAAQCLACRQGPWMRDGVLRSATWQRTWTNWFSDRLKKIKPAIKTSRKEPNGPYVHNKLSYVFFPSFSSGYPSCLCWQVTGHTNVTVMMTGLCPSCHCLNLGHIHLHVGSVVFIHQV